MKDSHIFEKLKNGDEFILGKVYEKFRIEFVFWLTKKYDCDNDEALDIYQNSFLTFVENIRNGVLTDFTCSIKTYLFSLGRNKYNEHKRYKEKFDSDMALLMEFEEHSHEEILNYENDLKKVRDSLKVLGEPCKKILEMYYYQQMPFEAICEAMDYKNEDTVKNQKYRCLQRLKKIYEQQTAKLQII